jgi:hypothetical protein
MGGLRKERHTVKLLQVPRINGSASIIRELESGPAVGARVVEHRPVGAFRVRATERLAIPTSLAPTASAHSASACVTYLRWLTTAAAHISRRPALIKLSLALGHARPAAVVAGGGMCVAARIVLVRRCCGSALIKLTLAEGLVAAQIVLVLRFCGFAHPRLLITEVGFVLAPKARVFGLLTRMAAVVNWVSLICTVCNTVAVIKPLGRVHLHFGLLSPRRKGR